MRCPSPARRALARALGLLRANFAWWPLHPAGYARAISYAMEYFWLHVFIAWLIKFLLVRYGGALVDADRHGSGRPRLQDLPVSLRLVADTHSRQ